MAGILVLILAFSQTPFFEAIKSYSVMSVYSAWNSQHSFLKEGNIKIDMPGGIATGQNDYYPFVMTFDASRGFSSYYNKALDLVILYNFPSFDLLKGASTLYKEDSPYYCAFYGAYLARQTTKKRDGRDTETDTVFGFDQEGKPDPTVIEQVTDYDLKVLVLESMGDQSPSVVYQSIVNKGSVTIDGRTFQVVDAKMTMDGMWHEYQKDYTSYLQYGSPPLEWSKTGESFEPVTGYGRIYINYDPITETSIFLYIIATDQDVIEDTEANFIMKTEITINEDS